MWVLGIAVLIAGCSTEPGPPEFQSTAESAVPESQSIAKSEIEGGLPAEAIIGEQPPFSPDASYPFPKAGWLDGGASFAIVLAGSSSCPSFPSSIEVIDPHTLKLGIDRRGGTPCSADMAPRTYVINTPAEIDLAQQVTLQYSESAVTLPAL